MIQQIEPILSNGGAGITASDQGRSLPEKKAGPASPARYRKRRKTVIQSKCGLKEDNGVISDFEMDWKYRYFFEKRGMKAPQVTHGGIINPELDDITDEVHLLSRHRGQRSFQL